MIALPALASGAGSSGTSPASAGTLAPCPAFSAHNFPNPTRIDNPFFPLLSGTTFVYAGQVGGESQIDVFHVTERTKLVAGVSSLVIKDVVHVAGQLTESTLDYFAQDRAGNVWYMGENTSQIENGTVVGHNGSWVAGLLGAQPGFIMLAHPDAGDFYCQENLPGTAQDQAKVLNIDTAVCVPEVCVRHHAMLTGETSPLDPGTVEQKWYVKGIGNVMSMDVTGGQDFTKLVEMYFHGV